MDKWEIDSSIVSISKNVNDIHFCSDTLGFLALDKGRLLRTEDGGSSWQLQVTGVENESYINLISFKDEDNGFLVYDDNKLLKTEDKGITWVKTEFITDEFLYSGFIRSIKFTSLENGILLYMDNLRPLIFLTDNGGSSWREVRIGDEHFNHESFKEMLFVSDSIGFISSESRYPVAMWDLMKTEDGGNSWDRIAFPKSNFWIRKLRYINNVLYAVTFDRLYYSYDLGNSWNYYENYFIDDYPRAAFLDICGNKKGDFFITGSRSIIYKFKIK